MGGERPVGEGLQAIGPKELIRDAAILGVKVGGGLVGKLSTEKKKALVALVVLSRGTGSVVSKDDLFQYCGNQDGDRDKAMRAMMRIYSRLRDSLEDAGLPGLVEIVQGQGFHLGMDGVRLVDSQGKEVDLGERTLSNQAGGAETGFVTTTVDPWGKIIHSVER